VKLQKYFVLTIQRC